MASFVTDFKHLEIQLEDIKSATNNFDETKVIGVGGFGKVYAGELSHSQSKEKSLVAIKRLDRRYGQGDPEFFKEIRMLSCYRHENLISLLGFCKQGGEMILIYEHASGGSLDHLLSSAALTWTQRLRICLDAAKGLSFLHDPNGTQQRVLHCDIKSANILLDKNMTAKVSDFGLSKMGPANQQYSLLITSAVGTPGYCDPLYMETYSLTKESDVYSFGVVLFEVLCRRRCVENINGQLKVYVPFWKKCYEDNKLNEIILQDLRQQMDPISVKTFSDIAFQCLRRAREERPTMSHVVKELEIALDSQEFPELRLKLLTKWETLLMDVDPLIICKTGSQLEELLSKGLIINEGKTWVSVNEKGRHIERIYIEACLEDDRLEHPSGGIVNSRFPGGQFYLYGYKKFKARVRSQYLTPQISYTLNLIFRYDNQSDISSYTPLRYNIDGEDETKVLIIYKPYMREDGWFVVPLYQFTSQHKTADFQFEFESRDKWLLVAGIEFQPSEEKVELQVFEEYQHILEAASQSLFYTSLEEVKQILRIGIHLNDYKTLFSHNEKEEHYHMISMKDCLIPNEDFPSRFNSSCWSRFPAGFYITNNKGFKTHVKTQLLSPSITYTVNLVIYSYLYCSDSLYYSHYDQVYVGLKYRLRGETITSIVNLANRRKDDGLFMAELYQFTSDGSIADFEIDFEDHGINIYGVDSIMFQPLEKVEDQVSKDEKLDNIATTSESESLNLSTDSLQWITENELHSVLRRRLLVDNSQQWFTFHKHGKKCLMLSARATWVADDKNSAFEPSYESRFREVLVITAGDSFKIKRDIKGEVLSPETTYACYLVYKLPQDQFVFEAPMFVQIDRLHVYRGWYIYLVNPPVTPVIGTKLDENSYNPLNKHKLNALPRKRSDGWMEVKAWDFKTYTIPYRVEMHLKLEHPVKKDLRGLIIQGIEIRPI